MDMDAIWDDSDLIRRSPKNPQPIRPKSPSIAPRNVPPPNLAEDELDALFAGIDELDRPIPDVDYEAIRRETRNQYAKAKRVNVLLSDDDDDDGTAQAPARTQTTGGQGSAKQATNEGEGKEKEKKRRPVVKLDEERLLGPNGFPALLGKYKSFKPSGKGNEAKDLQRLLQMYQLWAHKMYPKTQFRDTAEKVEKLCRSRRMHSALSGWKDEPRKSEVNGAADEGLIDLTLDADDDADGNAEDDADSPPRQPAPAPAAQRRPQVVTEDDGMDIEAMIAADEAEREEREELERRTTKSKEDAASRNQSVPAPTNIQQFGGGDDDWDIDAMIAADEEQRRIEESMDFDVEGVEEPDAGATAAPPGKVQSDEVMRDLVAEIEADLYS